MLKNKGILLLVMVGVSIFGLVFLQISSAATTAVPAEPELGMLTKGAVAITDSTSSGSGAVKFQADGKVIWNGDFSTGDFSQYAKIQYDTNVDSMTIVNDPAGLPRKAAKITVHNTSVDPAQDSPKHRAQAESPKVIGITDEVYIGYAVFLPNDFPKVHTAGPVTWGGSNVQQNSLWEMHGSPYGGSPPLGLRTRDSNDYQRFTMFQGKPINGVIWSQLFLDTGPPRGRWVDVVMHVKMSTDPNVGYVEKWLNWGTGWKQSTFKDGTTRYKMATVISTVNGGGSNYSKVSLYYNDNAWDVATVYFANHKIGTSFSIVDPGSYR